MGERATPSRRHLNALRDAHEGLNDALASAASLAGRCKGLARKVPELEQTVRKRLERAGSAAERAAARRSQLGGVQALGEAIRSWSDTAAELRVQSLGLGLGLGEDYGTVRPKTTGDLTRAAGSLSSQVASARRRAEIKQQAVEDSTWLNMHFRLDPQDHAYLLLRQLAKDLGLYASGAFVLELEPGKIEPGVEALPGHGGPVAVWAAQPGEMLLPLLWSVVIRDAVIEIQSILADAQTTLSEVETRAGSLAETERHADVLWRQGQAEAAAAQRAKEAKEAADRQRRLDDERRNREGTLATAGVVLIAPGLVASVYGANVIGSTATGLGMGLLMVLAVAVGFLAVRLVSHRGRAARPKEIAVVAALTYTAPFLLTASWNLLRTCFRKKESGRGSRIGGHGIAVRCR